MKETQGNYLINTAPELQKRFLSILKKMAYFSPLSEDLLLQLFKYSKFIKLADQKRIIVEGTFGQEIYVLIQGRLEVFIKTESGAEEQVDVRYKPFILVGQQCILGERYKASVEARGEVLLLGIDISTLPDMSAALNNPDKRLEDEAYRQSKDLYTVFATALLERLDRLIKDQYKLMQRIEVLYESQEYQSIWKENVLLTTIFNEFCRNQLSPRLEAHTILHRILEPYLHTEPRLSQLLQATSVDTEKVYMELVRAHSLEKLDNLNKIIGKIVRKIAHRANYFDEYTDSIQFHAHDIPEAISLSEFLNETYESIVTSDVLSKPLSKEDFLNAFLVDAHPNPSFLVKQLQEGGWVKNQFSLACIMYLVCKNSINAELEINKLIAQCIKYLALLGTPRQNIKMAHWKNQDQNRMLANELIEMYQSQAGNVDVIRKNLSPDSNQKSVEDMLTEYGL